ncbi:hypothetical protein H7B90_23670 [Cohnella xylanilytica]|uniref:Phage ABA sandwich domain-containing protein n=1 Tax=Cohnella xylanilytica TaxID=557555 RepID=A0A841U8X4_9BACL|nr:hypothetical protein [Cohnella xylanilytica]MBB6694400.1 hypothetical protein [Cohnella xylanilytica]
MSIPRRKSSRGLIGDRDEAIEYGDYDRILDEEGDRMSIVQPGPELDRRMAFEVMGFGATSTSFDPNTGILTIRSLREGESSVSFPSGIKKIEFVLGGQEVPSYSTTWNGMQLVVEEMQRRGMSFTLKSWPEESRYYANFDKINGQFADTAPHAVCMAALSALEEQADER